MTPLFLAGPNGKLFTSLYHPDRGVTDHWVIHIPAFAEEMNKCRPMVNRQARAFVDEGLTVVVLDLFGTGDSEGDFGEATLERWMRDIQFAVEWACVHGAEKLTLWGVRAGCLLVSQTLQQMPEQLRRKVQQLIFWQPVISGEQFVAQFLRLKVAAAMMVGEKLTVSDLRDSLKAGAELEVAGYSLNEHLIEPLACLTLKSFELNVSVQLRWYEVSSTPGKTLSPAAQKLIDSWCHSGSSVSSAVVCGAPFWSTQEIAFAPELINVTAGEQERENTPNSTADLDKGAEQERPISFICDGEQLTGILHVPAQPYSTDQLASKGVLLVVGGPQYRVGSHRQFVLLARHLSANGIPVFRFDYRGMGDSSGEYKGFEHINDDIRAALDCFYEQYPALREVTLWGLCDAATALAFYAPSDARVTNLVMVNPWVRSEAGEAKAKLKYYYLQRLFNKGFWAKLFGGKYRVGQSLSDLGSNVRKARERDDSSTGQSLIERFQRGLTGYGGRGLFIISGNDLTAKEFTDAVGASRVTKQLLHQPRFKWESLPEADHTFSNKVWRNKVASLTVEWIRSI